MEATGPLGATVGGRKAAPDEGMGPVFLAIVEAGFGALEGLFSLLLSLLLEGLADGWIDGRVEGTEGTRGPLFAGALWRARGRASGFRLSLLPAAGRWEAGLGEFTCR